jgi:hypothetical protein
MNLAAFVFVVLFLHNCEVHPTLHRYLTKAVNIPYTKPVTKNKFLLWRVAEGLAR